MVPLCPSRGLPAPGFSCPGGPGVRGSGQGLPSPCSLPTQPSGRRGTSFLGIFPKAYTRHVRRPTPASSLVQKHSFAPQTQASAGTSVTTQVKSPIPARPLGHGRAHPAGRSLLCGGSPLGHTDVFQRRARTHLGFPLPRRPPAGRPNNSLFMPTSRKGEVSKRWEGADKGTRDRQTARRKGRYGEKRGAH